MDKRLLSAVAALAAALPLVSHADTLAYTHGEISYLDTEIDAGNADISGDGFGLRGSIAIQETFFAFAEYQSVEFDSNVDASVMTLGGGAHWSLNDKLDIVGRVGISKAEVDVGAFGSVDEDGLMVGARLRAALMPRLEVEGGFDYRDIELVGKDTLLVLDGRYFFTENFAGGLMVELNDNGTNLGFNMRVTF
jgi:outer membrane protein with beta-barrel domain